MSDIRRKAQAQRTEIGLALDEAHSADTVARACRIVCRAGQDGPEPGWETVHRLAHAWLHGQNSLCISADPKPLETSARSKVDGGAPEQRREEEVRVFAAELLLPGPLARRLFWDEGLSSEAIADRLGLPPALVQLQLADAVLLPPTSDAAPSQPAPVSHSVELDPFQKAAAEIVSGPLLLGAGPGTGKTKTLVGRCQFLTQALAVPAERILALTFSRQAAQEMRERLTQAGVGTPKSGPWVGTFHGFGLELLRRFGDRLGLPAEIQLLDTLDAVTLLENHLPRLELDALDNLYNPAIHLGGIPRQISRAKDELCSPERYAELCREMAAQAECAAREFADKPGKKLKRDEDAVAKASEQAAKAQEVAHCYAVYETLMQEQGFLDFADLIGRSVALLEAHPDVLQTLQAEYPHLLADEYQDVNRACARLVRLLAGDEARGLWAVGDHRQSIYRFRGASPANVAAFHQDYPNGQRMELGVNYRSRQPVVDLFGTAARGMEAGEAPPPQFWGAGEESATASVFSFPNLAPQNWGRGAFWHARRGTDAAPAFPAVTLAIAPDPEGQADGMARAIQDLKAAGHAYRDQAVLCRTHGQAESLAALLSARAIPVLYLGALLERPEVKDLLCLLSLLADPDGSGLLRVAALPEYAVPQTETLAFLNQFALRQTPLADALQDPAQPDGLRRLGVHLAELKALENDPAALLRCYLFGQSRYLRHLTAERSPLVPNPNSGEPEGNPERPLPSAPAPQNWGGGASPAPQNWGGGVTGGSPFASLQQLMAIHHVLALASSFDRRIVAPNNSQEGPSHKTREFLRHLRRLTASGESLRPALPPEAEGLDAVRILTAHAAKGLEYPVVFLPNLGAGQFPARGRHDGIPEPSGLAPAAGQETDEEDCLFFVALSRARDVLVLSRAETSGAGSERAVKPSPLLELIQPWFMAQGVVETIWPAGRAEADAEDGLAHAPETLPTYSVSALETYVRCPRQYYYAQELKLAGTFQAGGYPQFHACVTQTLRWLEDERAAGREPTGAEWEAELESRWAEHGPVGHLHEEKYKNSARQMLRTAAQRETEAAERLDAKTLHATLLHCRVRVRPDVLHLSRADGALIVARRMTGKPGGDDTNDKRLALLRRAAAETHPDRPLRLELRYLSDGTVTELEPPSTDYKARLEADRVAKYDSAAQGIALRRFPAKPGDECRTCAYGLICPL